MNKHHFIIGLVVLVIVGLAFYFAVPKKSGPENVVGQEYKSDQYGFIFSLPDSWKGYSIVTGEWKGDSIDVAGQVQLGTVTGPMISIRHPKWTQENPRQDIPIMIFTIEEWNDMQADKFHIGAAPINPSEIARNLRYVFALPARYNFAYQTGYEEVDQIMQGKPMTTF